MLITESRSTGDDLPVREEQDHRTGYGPVQQNRIEHAGATGTLPRRQRQNQGKTYHGTEYKGGGGKS